MLMVYSIEYKLWNFYHYNETFFLPQMLFEANSI